MGGNQDGGTLYGSGADGRGEEIPGIGNERERVRKKGRIQPKHVQRLGRSVSEPARGLHPDR